MNRPEPRGAGTNRKGRYPSRARGVGGFDPVGPALIFAAAFALRLADAPLRIIVPFVAIGPIMIGGAWTVFRLLPEVKRLGRLEHREELSLTRLRAEPYLRERLIPKIDGYLFPIHMSMPVAAIGLLLKDDPIEDLLSVWMIFVIPQLMFGLLMYVAPIHFIGDRIIRGRLYKRLILHCRNVQRATTRFNAGWIALVIIPVGLAVVYALPREVLQLIIGFLYFPVIWLPMLDSSRYDKRNREKLLEIYFRPGH